MPSKKTRERYQNLSEEEQIKKWQYVSEPCRNLSEEKKHKEHQYGHERYRNF